jgi:hypothetical protein
MESKPSRRFTFDEPDLLAMELLQALRHCHMYVPLAPAAQDLGVGLRQPFPGKACGGMLGAIVRIAPPPDGGALARCFIDSSI